MKKSAILVASLLALQSQAKSPINPVKFRKPSAHSPIKLVVDGKPNAAVAVAIGNPSANQAAKELVRFVKLSTGASLPILKAGAKNPYPNVILIGAGKRTAELGINVDKLPLEGFQIKSFKHGIAFVARQPSAKEQVWFTKNDALLFATYDFLERYLGVRWYYPGDDGMVVPKHKDLTVEPVNYVDQPWLKRRELYPATVKNMPGINFPEHLLRYRIGDSQSVSSGCHTPSNVSMHFKTHPECYELRLNGTRDPEMPCYGNPASAELLFQDFVNFYEKGDTRPWLKQGHRLWNEPTTNTVKISPPDKGIACCCKYCKKLFEPEKDGIARAGRLMAEFVARVARKVWAKWPEKTVFYLPYSNYTVAPEDFTMPDNVKVMVCMMRGAGNYKEDSVKTDHDELIKVWSKITGKKVMLWEYMCWPSGDTRLPYQYPHVIQEFYQQNKDKVDGVFINGAAGPKELYGSFWAFQTPTVYCWLRLQWNPDFDVDAALDEYYRLMYGPAEAPMNSIFTLLMDRWENVKWAESLSSWHISPKQVHGETMPLAEVNKLKKYLAEARKKAGSKGLYRRRVEFFAKALELFFEESNNFYDTSSIPTLLALKVGGNPVIDGQLNGLCWRDAIKYSYKNAKKNIDIPPKNGTTVQAVWSADGVTFGFNMVEPHPGKMKKSFTERDQAVYAEDCIEIFIDPEAKRSDYIQVVVNSIGTIFDGKRGLGSSFNLDGIKAAGFTGKDFWSCEVYIPFKALNLKAKTSMIWYGNFTRSRYVGKAFELQRWNTRGTATNHDFGAFGIIKFVE
jgi:Domain of unknown function (DUF4838)